ncbi:MAG: Rrf2 family transcriptional regulator [Planctomycetaceae bacterium]|jgi:Rrf2 family protein|nr:Rrf2 family transcriptional regulator [Planctomycetaceae bacterium]
MKISTKGRYALRMMLDLAEHRNDGFIALKDIAKRQNISKKYLEQIVALLNRTDVLLTNRGAQGGYRLAQSPDKYTVGNILRITEGNISPVADWDSEQHRHENPTTAMASEVWRGLEKVITEYLDAMTLQDIIDKFGGSARYEYHI